MLNYAILLNNLGRNYFSKGEIDKSEPLITRALGLQRNYEFDHPNNAPIMGLWVP